MSEFVIKDEKGNEIKVGSFVNTEGDLEFETMPKAKRLEIVKRWNRNTPNFERFIADTYQRMPDGIVTDISDFDGDVDDDTGRSRTINPIITVEWPGEGNEKFNTHIVSSNYYGPEIHDCDIELECGDLVVLYRDHNNERGPLRIPYGGFTHHISPDGFAMMPEPTPEHWQRKINWR